MSQTVSGLVLAALVLGLSCLARAPAVAAYEARDPGYEDRYYLPAPEWLEVFALGHREALADLLWMRLLVYYGDEMVHRGDTTHVFDYAEAALALDPDFRDLYDAMSTLGVYRAQDVRAEDVEHAVAIMERGIERFPQDGELIWHTGATLAFELAPLYDDPVQRDRARERGADWMLRASELGAAPSYAAMGSAGILARMGRADAAARHLEQLYATTTDLDLRNTIAAALDELRSEAFSASFIEANTEFEDRWGREMPYAPPSFYYLAGPVPVVDTPRVLREGFAADAANGMPDFE